MGSLLQTTTDVVVKGALDGLAARHRAFLNNIANVETPGFQPSDVPFEAQLRQIRDERSGPMRAFAPERPLRLDAAPDDQQASRADGNGVQADQQAIRLMENTMTYEALAQAARIREEILR